jgi:hypothetical protein
VSLVEEVVVEPQAGPAGGGHVAVADALGRQLAVLQGRQAGAERLVGGAGVERAEAALAQDVGDRGAVGGGVEVGHALVLRAASTRRRYRKAAAPARSRK